MSIGPVKKEDIEKVMRNLKTGEINAMVEIPTGFECLDLMVGGLHKGQLVVIAGHPSMGKTAFMIGIIEHLCFNNNVPVAVFSMQLSRGQLIKRLLLSYSRIDIFKARYGTLNVDEWEIVNDTAKELITKSLYIDDTPRLTPAELKDRVKKLNREHRPSSPQCVFIDRLQIMDTEVHHSTRRQKTAEISESLKALASDFDIPVVLLCSLELRREEMFGERWRPKMDDLEENIIVDRYADMMILLSRGDYYYRGDADYEPNDNAEVMITRNRNGPTGVVSLRFQKDTLRFEELNFNE